MDDKEKQKKMSKAGLIGSLLAVAFGLLYMALNRAFDNWAISIALAGGISSAIGFAIGSSSAEKKAE